MVGGGFSRFAQRKTQAQNSTGERVPGAAAAVTNQQPAASSNDHGADDMFAPPAATGGSFGGFDDYFALPAAGGFDNYDDYGGGGPWMGGEHFESPATEHEFEVSTAVVTGGAHAATTGADHAVVGTSKDEVATVAETGDATPTAQPPNLTAPALTPVTTTGATGPSQNTVTPFQSTRHESVSTVIPPPKTPFRGQNGPAHSFRFQKQPNTSGINAAPMAAATVMQRAPVPALSPAVGAMENRTNPRGWTSKTMTHVTPVHPTKEGGSASEATGSVSLFKTPLFLGRRNNNNNNFVNNTMNQEKPTDVTPPPPPRLATTTTSNVTPAATTIPTGSFKTPAPSILGRFMGGNSNKQLPMVTPGSSSSAEAPTKKVAFALSPLPPNNSNASTSQFDMTPEPPIEPEPPHHHHTHYPPYDPRPELTEKEPKDTAFVVTPLPPGVDDDDDNSCTVDQHSNHNNEYNFDDVHDIFLRNCRDTNDRVHAMNEEILDLNVFLDMAQEEMLLLHSDMLELVDELEERMDEDEQILSEFSDFFDEET